MATYTVTKVTVRPNTSIAWSWDNAAYRGGMDDITVMTFTINLSDDELTHTSIQTWASKEEYLNLIVNKNDAKWKTISGATRTYMALNNFTSTVTEEDGTVRIFNSSNKTYEVQE